MIGHEMLEIKLTTSLTTEQQEWLNKNIHERYIYFYKHSNGKGTNLKNIPITYKEEHSLFFDNEKDATIFVLTCL